MKIWNIKTILAKNIYSFGVCFYDTDCAEKYAEYMLVQINMEEMIMIKVTHEKYRGRGDAGIETSIFL